MAIGSKRACAPVFGDAGQALDLPGIAGCAMALSVCLQAPEPMPPGIGVPFVGLLEAVEALGRRNDST